MTWARFARRGAPSRRRALHGLRVALAFAAALTPPPAAASNGEGSVLAKSTANTDVPPALPPPPIDTWGPRQPGAQTPVADPSPSTPSASDAALLPEEEDWTPTFGELGITVGLPYFDDEILRPDVNVEVRAGRRIAFFVPHVALGYRIARLDPNVVPDEVYANQIESPYVSVGARFEAPVSQTFVPFVGIGADLAWWSVTFDTAEYCQPGNQPEWYPSAWSCYEHDDWAFAPVYRAQLGLLIRPEPSLAIEVLGEAARIPPGDMFNRTVTLFTPSVGMAWHY